MSRYECRRREKDTKFMAIPNADAALIPPEKLRDYLLDEQHPIGGSKAKWFRSLGYDSAHAEIL